MSFLCTEQTNNKERQTHTQINNNKTQRKTAEEQDTNGKHAECDHVKKAANQKKQRSRILKHMKINI
jgi:hypothetical protein